MAMATVALALLAAGCPRQRSPFTDPDALVVAMYSGFTDQVVAATEPWKAEHPDVRLSLAPYQPRDFGQALVPRLLTGTNVPDVLVVDGDFLALGGRSGLLEDLSRPPYSAGPLLDGYPGALLAQARAGGAIHGVPAEAAPTILFYRQDLLDQAGLAEAELTRSWDAFVVACGRLHTATRTYCLPRVVDLVDVVVRADAPAGESPWFSAAGAPLADEARYTRAFDLARAANEIGIEAGMAAPGSDAWADLVRRGYFAVMLGGPTTVRRLEGMSPGTNGRWRAAPLPGGARVPAPSAFCALSARGARKPQAWEYVQRVCLARDAQLRAWREAGVLPASPAAAAAPAVEQPLPFLGGQAPGPVWRSEAAVLPAPGANRLDALARDAVGLELDYVLEEGKPVAAALAEARARIRRQLDRGKARE
jgi:multiple sugar transport system substrate-binding protein